MNADKLAKALDELPAAYDLLPLFMLPGSRPDMGSLQHHVAANARSLIVLAVVDLLDRRHKADAEPTREDYELDRLAGDRRQGILPTLSQWVRLVDGELWDLGHEHIGPEDSPTVASECAWLRSQLAWISQQQWSNEITDDVTSMLRDIRAVIQDIDVLKEQMFCLNPGCRWLVKEHDHGAWFSCTGCGAAWSRLELHRRAERMKPKSKAECAKLAGVSEKTLQRYKERGLLEVAARQGKTELFDLDTVMKLTMNLRYRQTEAA